MLSDSAIARSSLHPKKGARVFVVDDEALIGEFVGTILDQEGFDVACFSDPEAAWNAFEETDRKPELLLTDYVMTPINGMELIQRFRTKDPQFKAILYSGNVTGQITDKYQVKPDAFLNKPFLPNALVELVRSVLQR